MRQGGPGTLSLFCDVCGPRCLRLRCRELQHVELHHGFLLPDDHQHERALRKNEVHPASQDTKTSLSQEAKRPRQPGDSLRGTREEDYSEGDGDKEEQSDVIHRRVGEVREESSSESSDGGIEAFDADLGYSGEVSSVRTDAPILPSVSGGDVREEEEEEEPKEAPEEEQKEEEESSGDGESSVGTRDDGDTNNNREGLRLEKKSTFLWQEEERGLRGARLVRTWDASVEKALSLSSLCRNNCLLDFQTKHTWIRRREHHDGGPGGHHLLRGGVERDEGSQGEEIQARGDSEEETKWEIEQQRRKMTEHLLVLTESLRGDLWGTAIPSPYYDVVSCQEYGHVRKTSNLASDQKSLPRQEEDTQLNDHIHSSFQQQGKGPNDSMVSSSDEEVLSEENDKKPPLCLAVQKELNSDEASCQDPLSLPDGGSGPSDLKENRSDHGSRRPSLSSPLQHNDTAHLSSSRSPLLSSSSSSISLPQCEGTEPSGISKPFIAEPDKQRRVSPIPSDQPHKPLSSDAPASLLSKDEKEAVVSPSCSRIECDDLRSNPSSKRFFQKEESSLPDSCVMDQTGKGKKRGKREKATLVSRDGFEVYVLPMAAGEWIRIDSSIWFKVLRGAVEVRGHIFPPSSSYRLISSPPWSPTIRLMALKRFCNASEQRNDYVSQSSSLESLPGCFGEAESSAHLPEVSPGDRGHSHGGLASRTESRVQGSLQVEMKNGCMQRPWKEKLHFEGEKQFDNCTTKGPANECICIPETQFVEFTGGDPETTEAAFLASLQSLYRSFSTSQWADSGIEATAQNPALRRLLQVDERLLPEATASSAIRGLLSRYPPAKYPVVICFAEQRSHFGRTSIHHAVEPPAHAVLYRPLEFIPPVWRYVAQQLIRLFVKFSRRTRRASFICAPAALCPGCSYEQTARQKDRKDEKVWRRCHGSRRRWPAVVLWGGKGVGKTTFCCFLLNTLLNFFPKVAFLEADVGQPTFTLPGCVSLLEVTEPVLTPPHSLVDTFKHLTDLRHTPQSEGKRTASGSCSLPEQGRLVENIFFGDVSPKHAPYFYIRCISRCASLYSSRVPGILLELKQQLQHKARKHRDQKRDSIDREDHDNHIRSSSDVSISMKRKQPSPPPQQQRAAEEQEKLEEHISRRLNITERQSLPPLSGVSVHRNETTGCSTIIPLIVNTAGWTEGLGGQLLEAVGRLVRAAAVVRIVDEAKGEGTKDVMRNPTQDQNRSKDSRPSDSSSMLFPNKRITEKDKLPQSTMMMHGRTEEGMFIHPSVSQKTYSSVISFRTQGGYKETEETDNETGRGDSSGGYEESLQQPVLSSDARDDGTRQFQVEGRVKEENGREASLYTSGENTKEEQPVAAVNVPANRALTAGRHETAGRSDPQSRAPCPGGYGKSLPHEGEGASNISRTGITDLRLQRDQKPASGTTRSSYCGSVNAEDVRTAGTLQDCVMSSACLHGQPPITWSSESSDEDTDEVVKKESHEKEREKVKTSEDVSKVKCLDNAQRPLEYQAGETRGATVIPANFARRVLENCALGNTNASRSSALLLLQVFPLACLLSTASRSSEMTRRRFASVFAAHLQNVGSKMFPSFFSHHVLLHSPFSPTDVRPGSSWSSATVASSSDPLYQNRIDSTQLTPCRFRHRGVVSRRRRTRAPIIENDATSDTSSDVSQYVSSMASDSDAYGITAPQNRHVSCTNCGRRFVVAGGGSLADWPTGEGGLSGETSHSSRSVSKRTPSRNREDDVDTSACNFTEESRQSRKHRRRVCLYRLMQSKEEPVPSSNALHAHSTSVSLFSPGSTGCNCGVHIFRIPSFKQQLAYMHEVASEKTSRVAVPFPLPPPVDLFRLSGDSCRVGMENHETGSKGFLSVKDQLCKEFIEAPPSASSPSSLPFPSRRRLRQVYDEFVTDTSEDDESVCCSSTSQGAPQADLSTREKSRQASDCRETSRQGVNKGRVEQVDRSSDEKHDEMTEESEPSGEDVFLRKEDSKPLAARHLGVDKRGVEIASAALPCLHNTDDPGSATNPIEAPPSSEDLLTEGIVSDSGVIAKPNTSVKETYADCAKVLEKACYLREEAGSKEGDSYGQKNVTFSLDEQFLSCGVSSSSRQSGELREEGPDSQEISEEEAGSKGGASSVFGPSEDSLSQSGETCGEPQQRSVSMESALLREQGGRHKRGDSSGRKEGEEGRKNEDKGHKQASKGEEGDQMESHRRSRNEEFLGGGARKDDRLEEQTTRCRQHGLYSNVSPYGEDSMEEDVLHEANQKFRITSLSVKENDTVVVGHWSSSHRRPMPSPFQIRAANEGKMAAPPKVGVTCGQGWSSSCSSPLTQAPHVRSSACHPLPLPYTFISCTACSSLPRGFSQTVSEGRHPSPAELRWLRLLSHFVTAARAARGLPAVSWECVFSPCGYSTWNELESSSFLGVREQCPDGPEEFGSRDLADRQRWSPRSDCHFFLGGKHGANVPDVSSPLNADKRPADSQVIEDRLVERNKRCRGDLVSHERSMRSCESIRGRTGMHVMTESASSFSSPTDVGFLDGKLNDSEKGSEKDARRHTMSCSILGVSHEEGPGNSLFAGVDKGEARLESLRRDRGGLALMRPRRRFARLSLSKVRLSMRGELLGAEGGICGTEYHTRSYLGAKILSILPTSTVALAIDGQSPLPRRVNAPPRRGVHASTDLTTLHKSWLEVGKPRFSKKVVIELVEATEWQTCVCYAVVLRVDPSTSTILCLLGGGVSDTVLKKVNVLVVGSRALFRGTELLDLGNTGKSSRLIFGPKSLLNAPSVSPRCKPEQKGERKKPGEPSETCGDKSHSDGNQVKKCDAHANALTSKRERSEQSPEIVLNSRRAKRRRAARCAQKG